MSVDILMATYNGEKFLRNQILSILQQTFCDWKLYVRDDGSTDKTLDIISEFAQRDPRIVVIRDGDSNLGVAKNFFRLLEHSSAPYVIFCDQDDIWLEKKLESLFSFAQAKLRPDLPSYVYCDGYAYSDKQGVITSQSISTLHASELREFLFFNSGYQGCSILFNRTLLLKARAYRGYMYMHDDIISLIGHVFGEVFFLAKPLMLYRQHSSNITGNILFGFAKIKRMLFNKAGYVVSVRHYEEKKSFFEFFKSELSPDQHRLFNAYLQFPLVGLFSRLGILIHNRFSLGGHKMPLIIKSLIRKPLG